MQQQITKRIQLLPLLGAVVSFEGSLQRVSYREKEKANETTLLVIDIKLDESNTRVDHAWLSLGENGAKRISKLEKLISEQQSAIPFKAKAQVVLYGRPTGEQKLGLARPRNIEILLGGKWRCLSRKAEESALESIDYTEAFLAEKKRAAQEELIKRIPENARLDGATRQMIDHFYRLGKSLSDGQVGHLEKITARGFLPWSLE